MAGGGKIEVETAIVDGGARRANFISNSGNVNELGAFGNRTRRFSPTEVVSRK
jgi:hypothetical protein